MNDNFIIKITQWLSQLIIIILLVAGIKYLSIDILRFKLISWENISIIFFVAFVYYFLIKILENNYKEIK